MVKIQKTSRARKSVVPDTNLATAPKHKLTDEEKKARSKALRTERDKRYRQKLKEGRGSKEAADNRKATQARGAAKLAVDQQVLMGTMMPIPAETPINPSVVSQPSVQLSDHKQEVSAHMQTLVLLRNTMSNLSTAMYLLQNPTRRL